MSYDNPTIGTVIGSIADLASAGAELRARYEQQVAGLRAQCEAEQRSKEQLQQHLDTLRSEYNVQLTQLAQVRCVASRRALVFTVNLHRNVRSSGCHHRLRASLTTSR